MCRQHQHKPTNPVHLHCAQAQVFQKNQVCENQERTDQLPQAFTIVEVRIENPTVRTLVLDGEMEAAPGQFVMAWLPGLDEKPFSPSNTAPLSLTVSRVGPFTSAVHTLSPGDRIWLRGPFGQGFALPEGPLVAIGGGCGAAPLLDLARRARQAGHEVHVVLGARTADGLFFQDAYADLGCTVHLATDDGSAGVQGTSIDVAGRILDGRIDCAGTALGGLESTALPDCGPAGAVERRNATATNALGGLESTASPDSSPARAPLQRPTLYACGPEPMLEAAYGLAQSHGLPCQLSYEAYMRCGIGVCGSCAVGGCLVCRDGPVFSAPPGHEPRTE